MNAIHQLIRLGRDDRGRVEELLASMPMLRKTGEGEWFVVLESDEEGGIRVGLNDGAELARVIFSTAAKSSQGLSVGRFTSSNGTGLAFGLSITSSSADLKPHCA